MSNISREASENLFPWIEIYTIVLPLGNMGVVSQLLSCWLLYLVKLQSYQQVIKLWWVMELLTCSLPSDSETNSWKYSVFLMHLFLQKLSHDTL